MDLMTDLPLSSLILVLTPVLIALMALPWREEELDEVHTGVVAAIQLSQVFISWVADHSLTLARHAVRTAKASRPSPSAHTAHLATHIAG